MNFEKAIKALKEGNQIVNENWNGLKTGKIMYIRQQLPDEHSLNTEPYLVFVSGTFCKVGSLKEDVKYENETETGGWAFKRFPWTPSALDMYSNEWLIRC